MKRSVSIITIRKPLLAASAAAIAMTTSAAHAQSEPAAEGSGDIIVTAQKRAERLQDTPVPITAINTAELADHGVSRLQDYFSQVPGLSLNAQGNGKTNIIIRGITTAVFGNPTVAVSIDDVPFGATNATADGQLVQPDLDPADLERVEVLRGPQGTLYGASSLGGLIKYVTRDPSTEAVSGRVQGDVNTVRKGEAGYALRGSVNLPLSDTVAVRASGHMRRSPGYVDNVLSGQKDVNTVDVYGGRVAMMLKPNERIKVRLAVQHQDTRGDGTARTTTNFSLEPTFGDLKQRYLPDSGMFHTRSTLATANIDLDFDDVTITSVTGYGRNRNQERSDFSRSVGEPAAELANDMRTRKFTQEIRFAGQSGKPVEWMLGGFYTKEKSSSFQKIERVTPITGAPVAPAQTNIFTADFPTSYEELAAFGFVTVNFTSKFNIQGGMRYSGNRQTIFELDSGEFAGTLPGQPPVITADTAASDESFTFLVVPQYKFSPDLMAYARVASGYRPGGPNGAIFSDPTLPKSFKADTTMNYEAGVKGNLFDRHVTFDVSAYYIDWSKVHLQLIISGLSIFTNGGKASSKGIEGSFQYHNDSGLTIAANGSYGVARLEEDPPAAIPADKGTRLPFSPKFSGSLSIDQDFDIMEDWKASVGGTVAHVGRRFGPFQPVASRLNLPSYTTVDLRIGARNDDWSITAYVRNVADKRGVLSAAAEGSQAVTGVFGVNYVQPRTIGLSVARSF
ncbi:TonB-dependent receptor [Rhizorhabdus wittichii RW1]|uniref:TonB-dependent receptor n=1 Tax=Rhizorhabdus wittichii (strain DSM 6014 / CCUG 31198 / JCM 15750 / NBRC 105917 / EY 4224 / RW1) TaxID=392499 RepID=A0A9J9H9S3_RHIWR|nr:TonB-dependent receptor [Rhizorhabdus wittichii RW1]